MKLNNLKPAVGSTHSRRRIGRGPGSGLGGTSTRGHKGAKARSGYKRKIGFEGGQTPAFKRYPKRGFTNFTRKEYAIVNVADLNRFEDGATIDFEALKTAGLVKKELDGLKILGEGALEKKLIVKAKKFSKTAKKAIEEAGGTAEVL